MSLACKDGLEPKSRVVRALMHTQKCGFSYSVCCVKRLDWYWALLCFDVERNPHKMHLWIWENLTRQTILCLSVFGSFRNGVQVHLSPTSGIFSVKIHFMVIRTKQTHHLLLPGTAGRKALQESSDSSSFFTLKKQKFRYIYQKQWKRQGHVQCAVHPLSLASASAFEHNEPNCIAAGLTRPSSYPPFKIFYLRLEKERIHRVHGRKRESSSWWEIRGLNSCFCKVSQLQALSSVELFCAYSSDNLCLPWHCSRTCSSISGLMLLLNKSRVTEHSQDHFSEESTHQSECLFFRCQFQEKQQKTTNRSDIYTASQITLFQANTSCWSFNGQLNFIPSFPIGLFFWKSSLFKQTLKFQNAKICAQFEFSQNWKRPNYWITDKRKTGTSVCSSRKTSRFVFFHFPRLTHKNQKNGKKIQSSYKRGEKSPTTAWRHLGFSSKKLYWEHSNDKWDSIPEQIYRDLSTGR